MKEIRRCSPAFLTVGAVGITSLLGVCRKEDEVRPEPQIYEQPILLEEVLLDKRVGSQDIKKEEPLYGQTKIAFESNSDIYVMNADGRGIKRLTRDASLNGGPSWSPDGKWIAFNSYRDGNVEIYIMDSDGNNQRNITNNPASDIYPSWSPDGKQIFFQSFRNLRLNIYVMNADGSNQRNITNDSAVGYWEPSLSLNGKKIVFSSVRDGNREIYVMNADGSNQRRLMNNLSDDWNPSWSPDGKWIAFTSKREDNLEICVMDADGRNLRRLTNNPADDSFPSWSPDGKKMAFSSKRDGNQEIYIMDSDGNNQRRLTSNSVDDVSPSWSPFLEETQLTKKSAETNPKFEDNATRTKKTEEDKVVSQWFKSPEGGYRIPAITEKGWTYILRPSNLINPEGKIELPKTGVDQFFRRYEKDESELASLIVRWLPVTGTLEGEFAQSKQLLVERDKWGWVEGSLATIKVGDENGLQGKYIVDVSKGNKKLITNYMLVHRGLRAYEIVFAYTNRFPDSSQTLEDIVKNWQFINEKK
ncbi:MAG: DUF5050 domain-containing protein [Nanoarchaeota archaeon]